MTLISFNELTKRVHILNDLILSDMINANVDYSEEFINFSRHLSDTKNWFLRISWPNKRKYLLALLEELQSAWALSLLLKSLWSCRTKDAVMSASEIRPWSVYDFAPLDHNRTALPISSLGQVVTNNRKWFHMLNPEMQALVLSELLIISGGPIMWEVLTRGQKIYSQHQDLQLRDLLDCIVVDQNKVTTEEDPDKDISSIPAEQREKKRDSLDRRRSGLNQEMITAQRNLEVSLANWNTAIKSIRDSQKLEELEMTFKDGSVRKIWKVNRVKPEAIETVDYIQLLPSVVAKRIFSYLPRANISEYTKVNKYWSFILEEMKTEALAKAKMRVEKQKLTDLMLKHDISLETLQPSLLPHGGSIALSGDPFSMRRVAQSYRASERSAGNISFRHMVVDKLKPSHKMKAKPIKKLADLNERLYHRGAADENLWKWCRNALNYIKGRNPTPKAKRGVLSCAETHFPCPLMKHTVEIPLSKPLSRDPAVPLPVPKPRRQFTCGPVNVNYPSIHQKRYSLWSRDFSGLYKVVKVPSYSYPPYQ